MDGVNEDGRPGRGGEAEDYVDGAASVRLRTGGEETDVKVSYAAFGK